MMERSKNLLLVVEATLTFKSSPGAIEKLKCCVGTHNEDEEDTDIFFWFDDIDKIVGDHGDFTVHTFRVLDTCDDILTRKLVEYDDYMVTKCESEGYNLPISLEDFLELQVTPIAIAFFIAFLDLKKPRDQLVFMRVRELYLKHSVEVIDATEMTNVPVCWAEWLQHEGSGAEDV